MTLIPNNTEYAKILTGQTKLGMAVDGTAPREAWFLFSAHNFSYKPLKLNYVNYKRSLTVDIIYDGRKMENGCV